MTEAEVRYVKRLPGQLTAALRKATALQRAHARYGMTLEAEAQKLLHDLYGPLAPAYHAEEAYQKARRG